MFDARKLLTDLMDSNLPGTDGTVRDKAGQIEQLARDNPIATTGIAALLLGTGVGRSITGSALKLGGAAAVAGLAYRAYQNYQAGNAPQPATQPGAEAAILAPPENSGFDLEEAPQGADDFALSLVRAMVAAARADGNIDEAERERIASRLQKAGLERDAADFIARELDAPLDVDAIVATARTDAQKMELYTASRLAIDPDTRAERGYLDMLAGRLGLPEALIEHIEATVDSAKTGPGAA